MEFPGQDKLFRNVFMFCFNQNFEIFYKIQLWHINVMLYDKLDEQESHIGYINRLFMMIAESGLQKLSKSENGTSVRWSCFD